MIPLCRAVRDDSHELTQAVELRSRLQREIAAKEKEAKERELRELAMRARMDRVGGGAPAPAASRGAGTAAAGDSLVTACSSVRSGSMTTPAFAALASLTQVLSCNMPQTLSHSRQTLTPGHMHSLASAQAVIILEGVT